MGVLLHCWRHRNKDRRRGTQPHDALLPPPDPTMTNQFAISMVENSKSCNEVDQPLPANRT